MTDDDREPFEPEDIDSQEAEAGDPAEAFAALRRTVEDLAGDLGREMTTIRKGVEAAFDQYEKIQQPPDYGADLGQIVQQLAHVGERLEAVEKSPILKNGPEHYARALERSGESLIHTAAQQLEGKGRDLEREAINLAAYTKSAYDRKSQDFRMWMAGVVGLLAGVFLVLLLPRFLPFSADSHVASLIMGRDRVSAGYAIIRAAEPSESGKMEWGRKFYDANGGEVSACFEAARRTGKDQNCTITVPTPVE
ncbi:DUF6118 family protein [Manganibacter manganicus]|uniref:Uncharacterized protein n=1 Tax=Manganibacter manganicus TaxID=1873176 RepID=A0A1V8RLL0_9HYPH|nr:DUF6118 family protein [Pseudaminobacter manganicus]OQM74095.1 hypothetical protein BFN67_22755 [Pseudaminobacter manganicus]